MSQDHHDERAIVDIVVRASCRWDDRDPAVVADCFHDDGKLIVFKSGEKLGEWPKREAMMSRFKESMDIFVGVSVRHVVTNSLIETRTETHADVKSYVTVLVGTESGGFAIHGTGRYEDRLRHSPKGWLIESRTIRLD